MVRKSVVIFGLSLLASVAQPANATTLTFDNIPGGSIQDVFGDMPAYEGFLFSSTLDWIDLLLSPWDVGAHSGEFGILNNEGGVGVVNASDGSDFTFDGLWAKWWPTEPRPAGVNSLFGTLSGYNDGSQVWSVATSLDETYKFYGPRAGSIDELRLGFGEFFFVDDLLLNEPARVSDSTSTLALMIAGGLLGVFVQRWWS